MNNTPPKFTEEQIDFICYQIGEWYLEWKDCITETGVQHQLGYAKEKLKEKICPYFRDEP